MKMLWKVAITLLATALYCAVCYLGGSFMGTKLGTWLVQEE